MSNRLFSAALTLCFLIAPAMSANAIAEGAAEQQATKAKQVEMFRAKFLASRPDLVVESVTETPVDNLLMVQFANGQTVYASSDGEFVVLGKMLQLVDGGFVDLMEKQLEPRRAELIATVKPEDMIIFAPEGQDTKAVINVFTDVDCYYCQKLHSGIADMNKLGIEVRYLAFPRAGIGSESYNKIASAWCAKDPQDALTRLKNRQSIPTNVCPENPVAEQYRLGQEMGVTGTPAMITSDGRLMPGYMPPLQLARALGITVDPKLAAAMAAKQEKAPGQ